MEPPSSHDLVLTKAPVEFAAILPSVVLWAHAAGGHYYDWLFGNADCARRVLEGWVSNPDSELYVGRMVLAMRQGENVGGYLAVAGKDLGRYRQADALQLLKLVGRDNRRVVIGRLKEAAELLPPVESDELYLSKIGLLEAARGRGWGRVLLAHCLEEARRLGYCKCRLNVAADNVHAIRLYQTFGFRELPNPRRAIGQKEYLGMLNQW